MDEPGTKSPRKQIITGSFYIARSKKRPVYGHFGRKTIKKRKKYGVFEHAPLGKANEVQGDTPSENMTELTGIEAMQWARELSKLPDGDFTVVFFPYSRQRGEASAKLRTKEHCKWRTQAAGEHLSIKPDNLLLFTDQDGEPRMCYRILIRYMAFSQDGYKLHRINWLD